jgi:hypothetical protein
MQKIGHCKEIRLALVPSGIATCLQCCKFMLTVYTDLLVVTTPFTEVSFVASHNTGETAKTIKSSDEDGQLELSNS